MVGTKMIMGAAAVIGGAVGASLLKNQVIKQADLFGYPTEVVLGAGALLGGLYTGMPLLALAGAGALVPYATDKVLALASGTGTPVAGWPYAVGELPRGAAMYALPFGAERAADNLAASIPGLA